MIGYLIEEIDETKNEKQENQIKNLISFYNRRTCPQKIKRKMCGFENIKNVPRFEVMKWQSGNCSSYAT